jgi:hypothetical protein
MKAQGVNRGDRYEVLSLCRPLSIPLVMVAVVWLSVARVSAMGLTSLSMPPDFSVNTNGSGAVTTAHSGQTCSSASCTVTSGRVNGNAASNNVAANLPASNGSFNRVEVCKTDSSTNTVTIAANGTDTINGGPSFALSKQYQCADLVDATVGNWSVSNVAYPVAQALPAHNYANALTAVGALTGAQPACSDLTGAAAHCGTNASELNSGTVSPAQLPNPSASTIGGVESIAAQPHKWLNAISTAGVPAATQPASTDLSDLPVPISSGGTGTASPAGTAGAGLSVSGSFPNQQYSLQTPVSVANGGTGTSTPAGRAGSGLSVAGTFPNQQYSLTTPVAVANGGTGSNSAGAVAANNIGALAEANNLSDLPSNATALSNLGFGTPTEAGDETYYPNSSATVSAVPHLIHAGSGSLLTAVESCPQAAWTKSASVNVGNVIADSNGDTEYVVTAGQTGSSSAPSWPASNASNIGTQTTDNTVTWEMIAVGKFAPAAECTIEADPNRTYPVSSPIIVGTGSGGQVLEINGATISCIGTGGAGSGCLIIGNQGSIMGVGGRGGSGTNGNIIGGTSSASLDSLVESEGAYLENLQTNPIEYQPTNWYLANVNISASSSATINKAVVWESAIDGDGYTANVFIGPGPAGSTGLLVDDGVMTNAACTASSTPYRCCTGSGTGSCNQYWNELVFDDVWVGVGNDAYGVQTIGAGGGGGNFTWIGGAVVDGTANTAAHFSFNGGSHGLIDGVTLIDPYIEVNPGEHTAADGLDIFGTLNFTALSLSFNDAGDHLVNCVKIGNAADQVLINGRNNALACATTINNTIDNFTNATMGAFNYTYSNNYGTQPINDIAGLLNPAGPGGQGVYYSAAGTSIPACSSTLARYFACVSDAKACSSGTSYASGGSTGCLVQCNNAGTSWKETGLSCF